MTSRDEDFKALQLEMMDRYPHHLCPEELHQARSGDSAGRMSVPGSSEPNFFGPPGEPYGPAAESTPLHSWTASSYSEIAKDLDGRERRKVETEDRHYREVLRDCLFILVVVALVFVIILALAKHAYFGGEEESKDPPQPDLDIKSPVSTPRSQEKIIYRDRSAPALTPPGKVIAEEWPPAPGTEAKETELVDVTPFGK
ncbi:uncharacterized protein LOC144119665 [Amblyomma americanum]